MRTLFSDELNIQIGRESIRRLQRFEDEVGAALDLRLWGYLFLLTEVSDVARFEEAIELQHRYGIDSRLLTAAEARELVPPLAVDDVLAAAFCPMAGYVTPELVVQGYVRRATELGARVEQSCPATRLVVRDGCVAGVETPRGTIETERVVCAAGVWSRELAARAGVELPVEPERRWMFFTEEAAGFPDELPLTIDFSTGFYFHHEGSALALGGREQTLEELAPLAVRRVPSLETIGVRSSWLGLLRDEPRPQRDRRRGRAARGAVLCDRLLRTRLPARTGDRRALGRARPRPRADLRPRAVLAHALRCGTRALRTQRHLRGICSHPRPSLPRLPFSQRKPG